MGLTRRKRCKNCGCLYIPDSRNRTRQKYCRKPECRKASKKASQKKWLNKPGNKDYFKDSWHVERVQDWREKNPDYSKRSKPAKTLQDFLPAQEAENNINNGDFTKSSLQDFLLSQPPVIVGLIANFTGTTLQDSIALTLLRMQKFGQDILNPQTLLEGGKNDCKKTDFRNPSSKSPPQLQLD